MNQKGEVNLLFTLLVLGQAGLMILCALKLQYSFRLLERRTELFLCAKEAEGELTQFMLFMGRTNWAIKNVEKAKLIMIFVPGLQGGALNAEKAKRTLIKIQNLRLVSYLKKLKDIRSSSCPLLPHTFITPFQIGPAGFIRNGNGSAALRKEEWTNIYIRKPHMISVQWKARGLDSLSPRLQRISSEIVGKPLFY